MSAVAHIRIQQHITPYHTLINKLDMTRQWTPVKEYSDILFDTYNGIARITINRPEVYNAFRPQTNHQILEALGICRDRSDIRVVVLTGAGDKAFCSGGDQHYKSRGGYRDADGTPRLNVLDVHKAIRSLTKPVIAMVNGYAIGGGNVLQVVCDLTIASENAVSAKPGPKSAALTADSARRIWHVAWDRKRRARYGFCAANTQHKKLLKWV